MCVCKKCSGGVKGRLKADSNYQGRKRRLNGTTTSGYGVGKEQLSLECGESVDCFEGFCCFGYGGGARKASRMRVKSLCVE